MLPSGRRTLTPYDYLGGTGEAVWTYRRLFLKSPEECGFLVSFSRETVQFLPEGLQESLLRGKWG